MSEKRFLTFVSVGTTASGKTGIWNVVTAEGSEGRNPPNSGVLLGEVRWYAGWRRYVFYPLVGSLFDAKCLKEIVDFLDAKMEEHARSLQANED